MINQNKNRFESWKYIRQKKWTDNAGDLFFYLFLVVAIFLLGFFLSFIVTTVEGAKGGVLDISSSDADSAFVSPVGEPITSLSSVEDPCLLTNVYCEGEIIPYEIKGATITAFNTVEWQTDSSPCIAAGGNICGKTNVVACPRSISLGSRVSIAGTDYTCLDRLALKYDRRFDISFDKDLEGALAFGKQTHNVLVYEN